MSVYCPECGHQLQRATAREAGAVQCGQCLRPLADPNHEDRPAGVERGFRALFVDSIPMAIAWVLAGALLVALSLFLVFPVQVQGWLAGLGIPLGAASVAGGVPLRWVEILMIAVGLCAIVVLFRLPARRRSQGRM